MANDIAVTPSHNAGDPKAATEEILGRHYQQVKFIWGPNGTAIMLDDVLGQRLPVNLAQSALLPAALTPLGGIKNGPAEGTAIVSIALGTTISSAFDTAGMRNLGLLVPSTFDGVSLSFLVSDSLAGTYLALYDITNAQVVMTIAASRAYDMPGELTAWRFIKLVANTAQLTTTTDFTLVYRS
jgi:hypothetical protein